MGKIKRSKIKLSKDVTFRQLDADDGIILNFNTKNYYSLNETACLIVRGIEKGHTLEKIASTISKKFNAPAQTILKDINRIVSELSREKMIV